MYLPNLMQHPLGSGGTIPRLFTDPGDDSARIQNGNNISELENKSIAGYSSYIQTEVGRQMKYQVSGINGAGSMEPNDASDSITSYNTLSSAPANFVFIFAWMLTSTPPSTIYVSRLFFASNFYWLFARVPSTQKIQSRPFYNSGSVGILASTSNILVGVKYLFTVIYDQTAGVHKLRINGVTEATTTTMVGGSFASRILTLMNANPTSSISGPSWGGVPLLYTEIPPFYQIQQAERALANKYDIAI